MSPWQHWLPPAVQAWRFCAQVGGAVQTPPVQVSPVVQHGIVPLHDCPVLAQVGPVLPAQVPLVAPGGMLQVSPEQQSAVTVQLPAAWTHAARQKPASQRPEQHWAFVEQDVPTAVQDAPQVCATGSQAPKQQGVLALQGWPESAQVPPPDTVEQAQPTSVTWRQVVPVQHGSGEGAVVAPAAAQIEPEGRQVPASAQRSTPLASGVHGAPPQH